MEFSTRLKELRHEKGISQEKLAEQIHISRSAVAKWENGLGLPAADSLHLLAEYFGIPERELLPDQENAHALVEKNQIISRQDTLIDILLICTAAAACLFALALYPPLRQNIPPLIIGCVIILLGFFNLRGNISSIHWYHRRKVTKENQPAYCRCMGIGTVLCGLACVIGAAFPDAPEIFFFAPLCLGLLLMLFAQFKYNRGLF